MVTEVLFALVAQWIEHGSPKAGVGGSIPLWGTILRLTFMSINGMFMHVKMSSAVYRSPRTAVIGCVVVGAPTLTKIQLH